MKGHMQDGKFHPHTDYKKGIRKSRDQKAKTQGMMIRKQRSMSFKMNDRVITTKQCFEDVFKGDKGKIVGFDKPSDSIIVEFDLHRGQQYFVPQSCIILSRDEGIKHIQLIKNELNDNLIKMKISPDNLNITKERTNLQKQLKQLRKKYNYYDDQS